MRLKRCVLRLVLCAIALCSRAVATGGAETSATTPKVILEGGTQKDAEGAVAVCREWLSLWQSKRYEKASLLVVEPGRKSMLAHMRQRPIELKSVDDVRIFTYKERLIARVHCTVAPKQVIGVDMEYQYAKWWITAR